MKLNRGVVTYSELALLRWTLGCYRAPRAVNSSGPWIWNRNVLVFLVSFTGALAFGSLLCPLVFFPLTAVVTEPSWLKLCALHSAPFFSLFLKASLCTLEKFSLSLNSYLHLSTLIHTLNWWKQDREQLVSKYSLKSTSTGKHLTRLSLLSRMKMAGPLTRTLSCRVLADSSVEGARVVHGKGWNQNGLQLR